MSSFFDEFLKIAEIPQGARELLMMDPEQMDPSAVQHKEILARRTEALERVRGYKPSPEDLKIKKQFFRQMVGSGLGTAGLVGLGTGLGFGAGSVLSPTGQAKTWLGKHPLLLGSGIAGLGAVSLYASARAAKLKERKLQRARSVLKSRD